MIHTGKYLMISLKSISVGSTVLGDESKIEARLSQL